MSGRAGRLRRRRRVPQFDVSRREARRHRGHRRHADDQGSLSLARGHGFGGYARGSRREPLTDPALARWPSRASCAPAGQAFGESIRSRRSIAALAFSGPHDGVHDLPSSCRRRRSTAGHGLLDRMRSPTTAKCRSPVQPRSLRQAARLRHGRWRRRLARLAVARARPATTFPRSSRTSSTTRR